MEEIKGDSLVWIICIVESVRTVKVQGAGASLVVAPSHAGRWHHFQYPWRRETGKTRQGHIVDLFETFVYGTHLKGVID